MSSDTVKKPSHFPLVCVTFTRRAKIHAAPVKREQEHFVIWKHILILDSIPVSLIKINK